MNGKYVRFQRTILIFAALLVIAFLLGYAWMNSVTPPGDAFRLAVMAWAG